MKVIVNGEEIVVEGVQTLGELLNRVRENKENLVVKRIVIDCPAWKT